VDNSVADGADLRRRRKEALERRSVGWRFALVGGGADGVVRVDHAELQARRPGIDEEHPHDGAVS
jgi:hypothetical protein